MSTPDGLLWGYKFVGLDLCTDDHQGGRYRYRLGEWHEATDPTSHDGLCPRYAGDGLCVARTLAGAQSGGARLGSSVMLLVGYRPEDVLAEDRHKVRVRQLWVTPDPLDPTRTLIRPGANLTGANLTRANLTRADLTRANLAGADLTGADLARADLAGANLYGANLAGADLYGANLYGADLAGAYLAGADLAGANLYGANLAGANLTGANLTGVNLRGACGVRSEYLPEGWMLNADGYVVEES